MAFTTAADNKTIFTGTFNQTKTTPNTVVYANKDFSETGGIYILKSLLGDVPAKKVKITIEVVEEEG